MAAPPACLNLESGEIELCLGTSKQANAGAGVGKAQSETLADPAPGAGDQYREFL